jgi:hypothetical protein
MIIQIILTAICASLFFNTIHKLHIQWGINFKPFSCTSCLAAWVAVILYFTPELVLNVASVLFISGLLTPLIETLMEKLY